MPIAAASAITRCRSRAGHCGATARTAPASWMDIVGIVGTDWLPDRSQAVQRTAPRQDQLAADAGYLQTGSPSPAVVTSVFAVFTAIWQLFPLSAVCVIVADQKPAPTAITGVPTPVDWR